MLFSFLMVIFILDIILMVPVILLQSGSGAQSGVFGSDLTMGAFGAKTSEVLVNFTKWLIGIFFGAALLMSYIKINEYKSYVRSQQQTQNSGTQVPEIMTNSLTNGSTNSAVNSQSNAGPRTNP
ncbi:MAG: preprotein translocase subunit SecG [Brevinematales bacterium]|jgi:protein translocase SecG subunit